MDRRRPVRRTEPQARRVGVRFFADGEQVAGEAEFLERVREAGWRLTPAGTASLEGLRDGRRGEAA